VPPATRPLKSTVPRLCRTFAFPLHFSVPVGGTAAAIYMRLNGHARQAAGNNNNDDDLTIVIILIIIIVVNNVVRMQQKTQQQQYFARFLINAHIFAQTLP